MPALSFMPNRLLSLSFGLTLLLLAGCSARLGSPLADSAAAVREAGLPGLSELDTRRATSDLTAHVIAGKDALLRSSGSGINGSALDLAPAAAPDFDWAIYGFTPEYPLLSVKVQCSAPQGGVYVLIGNYAKQRWLSSGPFSGNAPIQLPLADAVNLSPGGSCYCAVLAYGHAARINTVTFNTDEPVTVFPTADLQITPTDIEKGQQATLDASASFDPDGNIVTFEWDLDGNGSFETNSGMLATQQVSPAEVGPHDYKVRVTDNAGAHGTASAQLQVHGGGIPSDPLPEDADIEVGHWPGIAVVNGRPALAFHDVTNGKVRFMRAKDANGTEWDDSIPVGDCTGINPQLLENYVRMLIVAGKPAICYSENDGGHRSLYYVRALDEDGAAWGQRVTLDNHEGNYNSIAIINGHPAVTYFYATISKLIYIRALDETGSSWGKKQPLTDEGFGEFTCLAEVNGRPAVSFYSPTDNDDSLYYMRALDADGAQWGPLQLVDHIIDGTAGYFNSLSVVSGVPAISYHTAILSGGGDSETTGTLRYVTAKDIDGAVWNEPRTLDDRADTGEDSSLLVVNGVPTISYFYDGDAEDLCYIKASDPIGLSWQEPLTLDTEGATGVCTCQTNVNGGAGVVYFDWSLRKLRYVWVY